MSIMPVTMNLSNNQNRFTAKEKVTNPIVSITKSCDNTKDISDAFSAYFKGGMALSFKGFDCSTGNFVTKTMDDVPCCCCGGKMVLNRNMGAKAKEFGALKGQELADKIRNNQDYFRTTRRLIANLIADEAEQHPEYDMGKAIQSFTPQTLKEKSIDYCVKHLNAANEVAKNSTGNEKNPISALINSEIEKVKSGKMERVEFTEKLIMYKNTVNDEDYDKIQDSVMNIPESYKDVKQVFDYAYGKSLKVAKELLKPSMQTIEHIHPKSQGGPNATQNYIAECYDCNNPRGHMSYAEWLKVHPEYPKNAQKHIEFFQQKMIDGEIDSSYDSYPVEVRETLSKESNGRMVLKVLNPEKIKELREAKQAGKNVDIKEELAKEYKEQDKKEQTEEAE